MAGRHDLQTGYPVAFKDAQRYGGPGMTPEEAAIEHDKIAYHDRLKTGPKASTEQACKYRPASASSTLSSDVRHMEDLEYEKALEDGEVKEIEAPANAPEQIQKPPRDLTVRFDPPSENSMEWARGHYTRRFPSIDGGS